MTFCDWSITHEVWTLQIARN